MISLKIFRSRYVFCASSDGIMAKKPVDATTCHFLLPVLIENPTALARRPHKAEISGERFGARAFSARAISTHPSPACGGLLRGSSTLGKRLRRQRAFAGARRNLSAADAPLQAPTPAFAGITPGFWLRHVIQLKGWPGNQDEKYNWMENISFRKENLHLLKIRCYFDQK